MGDWVSVGDERMLSKGEMREIEVGEERLLLARVGGEYFATQPRCPHLRFRLSRGKLDGKVITCPGHGSKFDVTTGRNLAWVEGLPGVVKGMAQAVSRPKDLMTFVAKIDNGQVWVDLESKT